MSFSVRATEYTPSSDLSDLISSFAGSASVSGTKQCICISFYKTGDCPFRHNCEHAHHFSELHPVAQNNFMTSVDRQDIAPHFVAASPVSNNCTAADLSSFTPAGMTPDWYPAALSDSPGAFSSGGMSPEIKGVVPSFTTSVSSSNGGGGVNPFSATGIDYAAMIGSIAASMPFSENGYTASPPSIPPTRAGTATPTPGSGNGQLLVSNVSVPSFTTNTSSPSHSQQVQAKTQAGALLYSPHSAHRPTDVSSTSSTNSALNRTNTTTNSRSGVAQTPKGAGGSGRRNGAMMLPPDCQYPHRCFQGTYYDVLGLSPTARHEDIIAQYRLWHREGFRRVREEDPEMAEKQDCLIVEARNVLGNVNLRNEYDELLKEAGVIGVA